MNEDGLGCLAKDGTSIGECIIDIYEKRSEVQQSHPRHLCTLDIDGQMISTPLWLEKINGADFWRARTSSQFSVF